MEYIAVMIAGLLLGGWAVPLGFALGLGPLATFAAAAGGGVVGCWGFLLAGDRLSALARRRKGSDSSDGADPEGRVADRPGDDGSTGPTDDAGRGRITRLVDRFGVRGFGIIGPIFPGVTASVIGGLAIGMDRRSLGTWMTIGIIVMYGLYVVGLSLIIELF